MKKITAIVLCVLLVFSATGCGETTGTPSTQPVGTPKTDYRTQPDQITEALGEVEKGTYTDLDRSGDYIVGKDGPFNSVSFAQPLTITEAGAYILNGSADSITVQADGDVQIILENVDVGSITFLGASKGYITLRDGFESSVVNISSEADLTINGGGSMSVNGAVSSNGTLTVAGGNIDIVAEGNGLVGGNVQMCGGNVNITAALNAVSTTDYSELFDTAALESESETVQNFAAEIVEIAENGTSHKIFIDGGTLTLNSASTVVYASGGLYINGGDITATSASNGLSGSSVTISGGNVTVNVPSDMDGITAMSSMASTGFVPFGEQATDENGTVWQWGSNDEADAQPPVLIPSDNDAQATPIPRVGDTPAGGDAPTRGNFVPARGNSLYIRITGGVITVNGSVMSYGAFSQEGGELYVNGAFSYMSDGNVTGGTLVVAGGSGTTGGLSDTSTQYSFLVNLSAEAREKSTLTVRDSSNNDILTHDFTTAFQSVLVSLPELKQGGVYTVSADGKTATVTLNSVAEGSTGGGMFGMFGNFDLASLGPGQRIVLDDGSVAQQFTTGDGNTVVISGDIDAAKGSGGGEVKAFEFNSDASGGISVRPAQPAGGSAPSISTGGGQQVFIGGSTKP